MNDLTFREGRPADAEAVASLVESAYRGETGRQGWTLEASLVTGRRTDAAAVRALVEAPHSRIVLAYRDGQLVGSCLIERRTEGAYLGMLSVRPGLQRSGVGGALVAEAERRAVQLWGARHVGIQVLAEDPRLVDWYVRQGYQPTGTRTPFAAPAGTWPLRNLHFVDMAKHVATGLRR